MPILIEDDALFTIKVSAQKNFPNECCGFLFGLGTEIQFAMEVTNSTLKSKTMAFQISSGDYMAAELLATEKRMELLGIYHSHPCEPAIPSIEDKEAALPNFIYLILSSNKQQINDLKAWKLNNVNVFEEQAIETINEAWLQF